MRRNWSSLRGTRGRAFLDGMAAPDDAPRQAPAAVATPSAPVCDRSGDVGTFHVWAEGAVVGDFCKCGKRRRFTPFPPKGAA